MENMEQRTMSLEIRSADVESRKLVGYAATFKEEYTKLTDRWGDVFYERVRPGAFKKSLSERDVFMLINHDWNKVVGRTGSNLTVEEFKGVRLVSTSKIKQHVGTMIGRSIVILMKWSYLK